MSLKGGWTRLWLLVSTLSLILIVFIGITDPPRYSAEAQSFGTAKDAEKDLAKLVNQHRGQCRNNEIAGNASVNGASGVNLAVYPKTTYNEDDYITWDDADKDSLESYGVYVSCKPKAFYWPSVFFGLIPGLVLMLFGLGLRWLYRGFRHTASAPKVS